MEPPPTSPIGRNHSGWGGGHLERPTPNPEGGAERNHETELGGEGGTQPGGAPRGDVTTLPPAASGSPAPASGVMAPAPATAEPSASSGTSSSMAAAAKGAGRARQATAAAELLPAPAAAAEQPGNGGDHRAREAPRPDTPRRLRAEVGRGHSRKWGRPLPSELIATRNLSVAIVLGTGTEIGTGIATGVGWEERGREWGPAYHRAAETERRQLCRRAEGGT